MATRAQPGEGAQPAQVFIRRSSGLTRQIGAWDALVYAIITPGFLWPFVFSMWAPSLYPGAHMPLATLAVLLFFPIAALYWLFSVAMPRSGGEYIYVSRVLHPVLGLMASFTISMVAVSWMAFGAQWAVKWGIGATIRAFGVLYNNPSWLSLADVFDNIWVQWIVGTVLIIGAGFIFLNGAKWVVRTAWIAIGMAAITIIAFIIAVIMGSGNFAANWTAMTGIDYNSIIPAAQSAGMTTQFSVSATIMAGATYVGLNTLSQTFSANIAGEIRGVQRSQLLALLGSLAVQLVIWFVLYQMLYVAYGADWSTSLVQLAYSGNAAYPYGAHEPIIVMMIVFLVRSPILPLIMGAGIFINAFAVNSGQVFAPTRNMFAWAFDRMIPPSFAELDRRFRSPWRVIVLCTVGGFVAFTVFLFKTEWMNMSSYSISAWFMAWIILGIAGILFPYVRKNLYESSPPIVKTRFLGVPVVTWLGALTLIVSLVIEWFTVEPMFKGLVPWQGIVTAAAFPIAPIFIYLASSIYWNRKGISLAMQFQEVPPEQSAVSPSRRSGLSSLAAEPSLSEQFSILPAKDRHLRVEAAAPVRPPSQAVPFSQRLLYGTIIVLF